MILLDTNVISALMHPRPEGAVMAWMDRQPRSSIGTTCISLFEVRFGLNTMPEGKKRSGLIHGFGLLLERIEHRVAPFDEAAALSAADLMASRQKLGTPRDLRDTMIAGIALSQHATLATRNTAHFSDISAIIVNPWTA